MDLLQYVQPVFWVLSVIVIAVIILLVIRKSKENREYAENLKEQEERKQILDEYREKSKTTSDLLTVCFPLPLRTEIHCFQNGEEIEMLGQDYKKDVYLDDDLTLSTIESTGKIYKGPGFKGYGKLIPKGGGTLRGIRSYDDGDSFISGGSSDDGPTLYHNWYADRGAVVEDSQGNTSDYNGRSYSDY